MLRGDEGQVESKVKVKPCLEGRIRRRLTVWHKVWSVFELWIAKRIIIVHLDIIHHLLRTLQSGCKKYKHSHYNTCVCLPHSLISYPFIFCSYIFRHAHTHTHTHAHTHTLPFIQHHIYCIILIYKVSCYFHSFHSTWLERSRIGRRDRGSKCWSPCDVIGRQW